MNDEKADHGMAEPEHAHEPYLQGVGSDHVACEEMVAEDIKGEKSTEAVQEVETLDVQNE